MNTVCERRFSRTEPRMADLLAGKVLDGVDDPAAENERILRELDELEFEEGQEYFNES